MKRRKSLEREGPHSHQQVCTSFSNKALNSYQLSYGRLYTWESAQEGCNLLGEGWRLPTNGEWEQLAKCHGFPEDSIDYRKGAYKALLYGGSGQFNVLFGGNRAPDGQYQRLEAHGFYWTATENDESTAWLCNFGAGGKFLNRHNDSEKSEAASVRCVKKGEVLK